MVRDYKEHNIPLDVLVTDMDWHITFYSQNAHDQVVLDLNTHFIAEYNSYDFQAGQRMGWTGFTWDKHLFPNPKMFLDWYVPDTQKVFRGEIFHPLSLVKILSIFLIQYQGYIEDMADIYHIGKKFEPLCNKM